jgi:hypothetical protein
MGMIPANEYLSRAIPMPCAAGIVAGVTLYRIA